MSRIRGYGNKDTELALAKLFRRVGITGWRRQAKLRFAVRSPESKVQSRKAVVRPDFVFPKQRVAVFVDGCFWHGCRWHCTYAKALHRDRRLKTQDPRLRTGRVFWLAKLAANKRRDRLVTRQLRRHGWTVLRIWEHELKAVSGQLAAVSFLCKIWQALRLPAGKASGQSGTFLVNT